MTQQTDQPDASAPIPIVYLIAGFSTEQAGTEGHLLRLIRRLDRTRYRPHLIVLQDSPWTQQHRDDPSMPVTSMGFQTFWKLGDWLVIRKLTKFFRDNGTKIVELHAVDAHFAGSIAAYLAKVPVVIPAADQADISMDQKRISCCDLAIGLYRDFLPMHKVWLTKCPPTNPFSETVST